MKKYIDGPSIVAGVRCQLCKDTGYALWSVIDEDGYEDLLEDYCSCPPGQALRASEEEGPDLDKEERAEYGCYSWEEPE